MYTSFQWINNENTLPSVTALYQAISSSSYFTVERAAKTLHRMSTCTPVGIPAKITLIYAEIDNCNFLSNRFKTNRFLSLNPYVARDVWSSTGNGTFDNPARRYEVQKINFARRAAVDYPIIFSIRQFAAVFHTEIGKLQYAVRMYWSWIFFVKKLWVR